MDVSLTELGRRAAKAWELAAPCRLCPRACGADRRRGEKGFCGAGRRAEFFLAYAHYGEDADICPAQTLYLTGCNLRCRFCQTAAESRRLPARELTPDGLAAIARRGASAGARFLNILGGEPTVNLPAILELLAAWPTAGAQRLALVWNTNLYGSAEAFELLDGVADVFMADLKFGGPACAAALAGEAGAVFTARARAAEIFARSPEKLIARHLLLPGHFDCCARPVLRWIAQALPGVRVSLKTAYLPPAALADGAPEKRLLSLAEAEAARALAASLGLRLTREPPEPPSPEPPSPEPPKIFLPAGGEAGVGDEAVPLEILIAPDGRVVLRHVVRQAAEIMRSLEARHE